MHFVVNIKNVNGLISKLFLGKLNVFVFFLINRTLASIF
ncbi:putative membrane protein [Escherichia coli 2726800]|nr:putative membrane protein [Escherichia coli 2726800]END46409.1 putative membrane protein [Escherichia coli 2854350]